MAYQKLQAGRAAAVTPSDTSNIPSINGGVNNGCILYVGGAGNVKVLTIGGDEVTLFSAQAGLVIPVKVLKVFATGTTATNIVALW